MKSLQAPASQEPEDLSELSRSSGPYQDFDAGYSNYAQRANQFDYRHAMMQSESKNDINNWLPFSRSALSQGEMRDRDFSQNLG
jgi:hypothetical protein